MSKNKVGGFLVGVDGAIAAIAAKDNAGVAGPKGKWVLWVPKDHGVHEGVTEHRDLGAQRGQGVRKGSMATLGQRGLLGR